MKSKIKIISILTLPVLLFFVNIAFAQDSGLVGCTDDCSIRDLFRMVLAVINFLLSFAALAAMLFVVWAGWNMVTSGGNEEKITAAKSIFSHAIIGFFLVMVAFILLDAIAMILGGFKLTELLDFIL